MPSFSQPSRITITCNKRLTPFLHKELEEGGWKIFKKFPTGAELRGSLNDCIRLNITLRCASQVLYSIKSFECTSPQQLYDTVSTIQWETMFSEDGYFSITSNVDHPTVNNNLFVNVKIKDAIVDRFRSKFGKRPDSGSDLDKAVIHLFWKDDNAEIFIDTSGETLAKHGYRRIPGQAPMMESLAAGTLLASKWDRQSPFVNPMCGSGTVAIEAAMLATGRYPGLCRDNYSFMHITGYDSEVYETALEKIKDGIVYLPKLKIIATDISEDAINISKINAGAAGVEGLIDFAVCDFRETAIPEQPGVVYFNPEYGERLGNIEELEVTYGELGNFMKQQCKGYTGYIFTGNLELAKKIGLKTTRKIEFWNGKIDCRLLEYELYAGSKREIKN